MGIGDLFRGFFSSTPARVDYSVLGDEELLRLSSDRARLTPDAKEELIAELKRRDLAPREPLEPEPEYKSGFQIARELQEAAEAREETGRAIPRIEGDPVVVLERRGVVLKTQATAGVLLMLPIWDDTAPFVVERPEFRANVTEIILFNDLPEGWLPAAYVTDRLKVRGSRVFVMTEDEPADRPLRNVPSPMKLTGRPLEEEMELGWLVLEKTDHPGVLIASWETDEIDLVIAIGPRVPIELVFEEQVTHVIGGIAEPTSERERDILADPELYANLQDVILLLDCAGVSSWPLFLLSQVGVNVSTVGREPNSESDELLVKMKQAVDAGDWDDAKTLLDELSAEEIEDLVDGLTLERNMEAARRVIDLALASEDWAGSGRILFLRGVHAFMSKDEEAAMIAYRQALAAEEPEPRAHANLSAILRRRGDHEAAIASAEAAVEAMPEDAVSIVNLALSVGVAGRIEEAKRLIEDKVDFLGPRQAAEWQARLDALPASADGPDVFPHLADKAYQIGSIYEAQGRTDEALEMYRRCLELQPSHLECVLDLGALLSAVGREEEAIALYDAQLEVIPAMAFIRFNRANCLLRLDRTGEAIPELHRVVEEVPEWDAPYVNLASALQQNGDVEGARRIVDALADNVPESDHLETLRLQVEGAS